MQEKNDLAFTVVSDPGQHLARRLGILTQPSEEARATLYWRLRAICQRGRRGEPGLSAMVGLERREAWSAQEPRRGPAGAASCFPYNPCHPVTATAMSAAAAAVMFLVGAGASLSAAWLVVSRIERLGARLGAPEALLGVFAALAGDAPEITSAVSALVDHQGAVAAGVSIGSNVFNLAALLGLGAILAGGVGVHRRAVVLEGAVAVWIGGCCLLAVLGALTPGEGLAAVGFVMVPYLVLAATSTSRRQRWSGRARWQRWLAAAVAEEEAELSATVHPPRGQAGDALVGGAALAVVVVASVAMEHAASGLGNRFGVSEIVIGGVVLAAVTSLPNAVAAIYWARRDRGVAMLSTGLNSNAFNVAAGFLFPAVVLGLGRRSDGEVVTAGWYLGLTVVVLVLAYRRRALSRASGWLVVGMYVAFVAVIVS